MGLPAGVHRANGLPIHCESISTDNQQIHQRCTLCRNPKTKRPPGYFKGQIPRQPRDDKGHRKPEREPQCDPKQVAMPRRCHRPPFCPTSRFYLAALAGVCTGSAEGAEVAGGCPVSCFSPLMSMSPPLNRTYMLRAANTTNPTIIFHMVSAPNSGSKKTPLCFGATRALVLKG